MTNGNPESDSKETKVEVSEEESQSTADSSKSSAESASDSPRKQETLSDFAEESAAPEASGAAEAERASGDEPVSEDQSSTLPADELPSEELPSEELPSEELPSEELPNEELPAEQVGDAAESASAVEVSSDEVGAASTDDPGESIVEEVVEIPNAAPHEVAESGEAVEPGKAVAGEPVTGEAASGEATTEGDVESKESTDGSDLETADTEQGGGDAAESEKTISAEDLQERLDAARHTAVSVLFAKERPSQQELTDVLESYSQVLQEADQTGQSVADEFGKLTATIDYQHQELLDQEREQLSQVNSDATRCVETYNEMFLKIDELGQSIESVIKGMEEDEPFQAAPQEMQDLLLNYRKGIEILLRMATRMQSRKKDLTVDSPGLSEHFEKGTAPETFVGLTDTVTSLTKSFHDLRDINYRALHDGKDRYMSSRQAILANVKGLLGVIDGIDRGYQDADQTRSTFEQFPDHQELAAKWLGSYETLHQIIGDFLDSIGVESMTVQPGDPYDTHKMDPIATEEHPEFEDESVASQSARGLAWDEELIRPIQVVVVKNPQS